MKKCYECGNLVLELSPQSRCVSCEYKRNLANLRENVELRDRIDELEHNNQTWISVDKELPPTFEGMRFYNVLAIHSGWDNQARVLMWDSLNEVFTRDGDDTQKVTHWMPLPTPPKKVKTCCEGGGMSAGCFHDNCTGCKTK